MKHTSTHRLYDSIKNVGLLKPLVYTKNSDTQDYELYGGGKTRVRLLDEIQQERQESGLRPLPVCIVIRNTLKTTKEIDLSHLIQNHIRSDRTFIDKALHLNDCIESREAEIERKMSQRETVRWLGKSGFPISQSLVNDMQFAARTLHPLLPQALDNGMGRRHVVRVRKLHRGMREIWQAHGENLNDCREAFDDICNECDDKIFDVGQFQEVMVREVCLWCDLNSQHTRAMLLVDRAEREKLHRSTACADSKSTTRIRPKTKTLQIKANKNLSRSKSSMCAPIASDFRPAAVNRRKRFARCIAMELAQSGNLLEYFSGTMSNTIGYSVPHPASSSDTGMSTIWQFLHFCQRAVEIESAKNQRVVNCWRSLNSMEFEKVCSLIDISRMLCAAQRSTSDNKRNLPKAA